MSDVSPVPGVVRLSDEAALGTYSYVQITHVLEHVPEPLALLKRVACLVKPSGYLYVEVPQDLSDAEIADLKNGVVRHGLPIHEHINMYWRVSVILRQPLPANADNFEYVMNVRVRKLKLITAMCLMPNEGDTVAVAMPVKSYLQGYVVTIRVTIYCAI